MLHWHPEQWLLTLSINAHASFPSSAMPPSPTTSDLVVSFHCSLLVCGYPSYLPSLHNHFDYRSLNRSQLNQGSFLSFAKQRHTISCYRSSPQRIYNYTDFMIRWDVFHRMAHASENLDACGVHGSLPISLDTLLPKIHQHSTLGTASWCSSLRCIGVIQRSMEASPHWHLLPLFRVVFPYLDLLEN